MWFHEEANKDEKRSTVIKETESKAGFGIWTFAAEQLATFRCDGSSSDRGEFVRKGRPVVVSLYAEKSSSSGRLDLDLLDSTQGECH